jgi:hypothetical protein
VPQDAIRIVTEFFSLRRSPRRASWLWAYAHGAAGVLRLGVNRILSADT